MEPCVELHHVLLLKRNLEAWRTVLLIVMPNIGFLLGVAHLLLAALRLASWDPTQLTSRFSLQMILSYHADTCLLKESATQTVGSEEVCWGTVNSVSC